VSKYSNSLNFVEYLLFAVIMGMAAYCAAGEIDKFKKEQKALRADVEQLQQSLKGQK